MFKIVLNAETATPPVASPSGFIFENARGGPYRYGYPLMFNAEVARRIQAGQI